MVRTVGKDWVDHPFSTSASCTALAVILVYIKVVRRLDSDALCGSMMGNQGPSTRGSPVRASA